MCMTSRMPAPVRERDDDQLVDRVAEHRAQAGDPFVIGSIAAPDDESCGRRARTRHRLRGVPGVRSGPELASEGESSAEEPASCAAGSCARARPCPCGTGSPHGRRRWMRLERRSNRASRHAPWGAAAPSAPHDRIISTNRSNSSVARARSGGAVKFSARHCSAIVLSSTNASRGCLRSTCVSWSVSDWATLSISIPGALRSVREKQVWRPQRPGLSAQCLCARSPGEEGQHVNSIGSGSIPDRTA